MALLLVILVFFGFSAAPIQTWKHWCQIFKKPQQLKSIFLAHIGKKKKKTVDNQTHFTFTTANTDTAKQTVRRFQQLLSLLQEAFGTWMMCRNQLDHLNHFGHKMQPTIFFLRHSRRKAKQKHTHSELRRHVSDSPTLSSRLLNRY